MSAFLAFLAFLLFIFALAPAHAGRIEAPFPLAKFGADAQLIVKAMVISTQLAQPSHLFMDKISRPVDAMTHLRVVSVLKGDLAPTDEFTLIINRRHKTTR